MAFNDFVQTELPLRPFAAEDGPQGSIPVREGPGPRQVVFKTLAQLGIGGALPVPVEIIMEEGVATYTMPYPAIAGVYLAMLNGLLTKVQVVNGNQVTVTEFPASEYEAGEVLTFYLIL